MVKRCAPIVLSLAAVVLGRSPPAAPPAAEETRSGGPPVKLEQLPPAVRLGLRVELARQQLPTIRTLVIVPDARSFAAAVGAWRIDARFPVLIDDGSWEARENIARFARGMAAMPAGTGAAASGSRAEPAGPVPVVRWKVGDDFAWPDDAAARQKAVADAAARAWSAPDAGALKQHWATLGFVPPGVVVASTADPAWTAGLTLAAARGQPMVWLDRPGGVGDVNSAAPLAAFDAFNEKLMGALEETGYPWKGLGEGIDAVTLCLNMAGRIAVPPDASGKQREKPDPRDLFKAVPGEPLATTDLLGRNTGGDRIDRWAWCGQVFGTEAQAAYRAMAGIFLQNKDAWLFNGYEGGAPWNQFAPGEGAALLKKAGWAVRVSDAPKQGAADFRDVAAGGWTTVGWNARKGKAEAEPGPGGLRAALIAVTTSGMSESFDLRTGQAVSGDVPLLDTPSLVYFVHSWSANSPGYRATIAGRWLERGAAAYVGSIHEPYLSAFVPPSGLVSRLLAPAPLGAAARIDGTPPWRVTVIGDPLLTLGAPEPQSGAPLALTGARDVKADLAEQLNTKDYAAALWALAYLGRDKDATRLTGAILREEADRLTKEVGLAGVGPAFRQVDQAALAPLLEAALADEAAAPALQDLAWHALGSAAPKLSDGDLRVLARCVREGNFKRDTEELSRFIRKAKGEGAAKAYLEESLRKAPNPGIREQIQRLINGAKKP